MRTIGTTYSVHAFLHNAWRIFNCGEEFFNKLPQGVDDSTDVGGVTAIRITDRTKMRSDLNIN